MATRICRLALCVQVLTTLDDFANVRDKVMELGLTVDHDSSGLVFSPLMSIEVCGQAQLWQYIIRSWPRSIVAILQTMRIQVDAALEGCCASR